VASTSSRTFIPKYACLHRDARVELLGTCPLTFTLPHQLFTKFPVTAGFFNKDRVAPEGSDHAGIPPQVAALAGAVVAYAKHIEDVTPIMPVVVRICHKHVSRNVRGPHYQLVGKCLLAAIGDVLGPDVATEGVMAAWKAAFASLADAFVATETGIRAAAKETAGFEGYKEFTIAKVVEHTGGAKTFSLTGDKIPPHSGGQYISFELLDVPGLGKAKTTAMLSDTSSDVMTFTVFPKDGERPIAFMLDHKTGDKLRASVPCGPFRVDAAAASKLAHVTVAGGAEEAGMVAAVGQDLLKAGVRRVRLVVEGDAECAKLVAGDAMAVETVEKMSARALITPTTDGVFAAPSLGGLVASLAAPDAAVGHTTPLYTAIIE
jgi:nitric oxide dioxygenase